MNIFERFRPVGQAKRSATAGRPRLHLVCDAGSTGQTVSHDDLLRFVDGALDDEGRVRVLTHLASRPKSVERVEAYLQQNMRLRALRASLRMADSASFAAPLQSAIVMELSRNRQQRGQRRTAVAVTLMLGFVGGIVGLAMHQSNNPTVTAGVTLDEAFFFFERHELGKVIEADIAAASPSAADPAAVAPLTDWATKVTLTAPELASVGLDLIDTEVLERAGASAIRSIYRDATGKPVVLLAGIGKPEVPHAFWLEREGYVSLHWRRGPMVFAVVAPTESPQLSLIIEHVSKAVADIVLPEPNEAVTAGSEPTLPQLAPPLLSEAGPLQSIAVPAAPAAEPQADPAAPTDPETIHPGTLSEAGSSNAPEPL